MVTRQYTYVGPPEIRQRTRRESHCIPVNSPGDVVAWIATSQAGSRRRDPVTATFIIDAEEQLWIADRRSEHIACADGQDVLAAGEMTFEQVGRGIEVVEVSNQSTGYCPEPACWAVVAHVLDAIGLPHPARFTVAFEFRRCDQCGTTNLIKEDIFECSVCGSSLSAHWNYPKVGRI